VEGDVLHHVKREGDCLGGGMSRRGNMSGEMSGSQLDTLPGFTSALGEEFLPYLFWLRYTPTQTSLTKHERVVLVVV